MSPDSDRDGLAALRRNSFGSIFQQYHLISTVSALGNVEMPAIHAGAPRAYRHRRASALLARLGLATRMFNRPSQTRAARSSVSGSRSLMNGGGLILADEATGALDSKSGTEVLGS